MSTTKGLIEDHNKLNEIADKFKPDIKIYLATQATLRYSLKKSSYLYKFKYNKQFNVMELVRKYKVNHLLMSSTYSVYDANTKIRFTETEKVDTQFTIYVATKKFNESVIYSYSYLWKISTTVFCFFYNLWTMK